MGSILVLGLSGRHRTLHSLSQRSVHRLLLLRHGRSKWRPFLNKLIHLILIYRILNLNHFVNEQKTWSMARDYCRAHAMELVSIETEEERAKLNAVIPATNYEGWWTSGSDEGHEGQWMWTASGQPFNYAYWAKKQPDGGSIENHLLLKRFTFYWHDSEGNYGHEFSICESTVE